MIVILNMESVEPERSTVSCWNGSQQVDPACWQNIGQGSWRSRAAEDPFGPIAEHVWLR